MDPERKEALLYLAAWRRHHLAERADLHRTTYGATREALLRTKARKMRLYRDRDEWLMWQADEQFPGIIVNQRMMP